MKKSLKSTIASVLLGAFIMSSFVALPAEAKPKQDNGNGKKIHSEYKHHKKDKKEQRDCNDIILTVLALDSFNYGRARRAGMSLEDLIITQYIASKITGHDFEDIFWMQKNGKPYKEICKAYGINWGSVRSQVKNKHQKMSDDAIAAGLIMWGLHEILH